MLSTILSQFSILQVLICIFILKIATTSCQEASTPPATIFTRIVHHHSMDSPYFEPDRTIQEKAEIDLQSSISRASYLMKTNSSTLFHVTDIESSLTPAKGLGFLAELHVGQKGVQQFVYMDSGSSMLWINCEPCGLRVPAPLYHPAESSSYEIENCNGEGGEVCLRRPGAVSITCKDYSKPCDYEIRYANGMFSSGDLARETMKFGNSKDTLKRILFGCSRKTSMFVNGVMGLGFLDLSLVSQRKSSKFSYCIGNIYDENYPYNNLVIGDKIRLRGSLTPLIIEDKYYITLEYIKVGDTLLDIDERIFERMPSEYRVGMLVDTGSTLSFIPQVALGEFEAAVMDIIDMILPKNDSIKYQDYERLCYNGILDRDLYGFPTVQFQFKNDATMELSPENIFQQVSDQTFCLAILPSETLSLPFSLLGSIMQQFFYVVIDYGQKKLSFERFDCSSVEDYIRNEL